MPDDQVDLWLAQLQAGLETLDLQHDVVDDQVDETPASMPCPQCHADIQLGPRGHILDHHDAMGGMCIATGRKPDGE